MAPKLPQRVSEEPGTAILRAEETPMRMLALLLICTSLASCGAVALPFRATADVARIVPGVGDAVATPFDATGDAIDPPGH
jgi:hypothetical protein